MSTEITMDKIVALCKHRGFIFQGSEIYGGLANTWDFGPLGVELKNNIKQAWWKRFVQESPYNVGLDAAILMNTKAWEASGHLSSFADPLTDCRECKSRHRADKLIEQHLHEKGDEIEGIDGWDNDRLIGYIRDNEINCPHCGASNFTDVRQFNLMFKTFQGVTEDSQSVVYLRPETAQGIFVNFKSVQRSMRKRVPFGIGQIGKSFRNEITPGNFIFRTREFEQMELQFFCEPGTDEEWHEYWKSACQQFLVDLGADEDKLRMRDHTAEELSHYSKATVDIEYLFPFGWGEVWGIANRTDFDLNAHMAASGEDMHYIDPQTNERYIPFVVEPSVGVERLVLLFLVNAFEEEQLENDTRRVLRFHPAIAPFKAAVLPLSRKLSEEATELWNSLRKHFPVDYDETAAIGRRYRRQDEIGTPYCITYDFDSQQDQSVTIRDRDSMEQVRLPIDQVVPWLQERLTF